ncbi:MAG: bifunctional demethylmenaquinone methyltransferase/2-methoxy-6-polyprenyl-1,4-benzoquinol methylase UbiE [Ignavibacteriales bacterium]|nr:bifunctional demethylmenaquinone methyltransferase/2-methoxy-6-polyprenyl-1,4-benzoquinol methylase UbiE [Ignavibacteriales bacterium]
MPNHRTPYDPLYVRNLFDRIAGRYDFLNHLLSSGIDILWRKRAVRLLRPLKPQSILDVATGTGDFAFEASRLRPREIIGIDVSTEMLRVAARKAVRRNLETMVSFQAGAAEQLPFSDKMFDAVIVAFGIRNFSSLEGGLAEMCRVLRPGGAVLILEFSRPHFFPIRKLYSFYSKHILPFVGGLVSKNRDAYEYLPNTIREFPDRREILTILQTAGFSGVQFHELTFGIATIYYGTKGTNGTSADATQG